LIACRWAYAPAARPDAPLHPAEVPAKEIDSVGARTVQRNVEPAARDREAVIVAGPCPTERRDITGKVKAHAAAKDLSIATGSRYAQACSPRSLDSHDHAPRLLSTSALTYRVALSSTRRAMSSPYTVSVVQGLECSHTQCGTALRHSMRSAMVLSRQPGQHGPPTAQRSERRSGSSSGSGPADTGSASTGMTACGLSPPQRGGSRRSAARPGWWRGQRWTTRRRPPTTASCRGRRSRSSCRRT